MSTADRTRLYAWGFLTLEGVCPDCGQDEPCPCEPADEPVVWDPRPDPRDHPEYWRE